jgi:PEP-CTERM motif
MKITLIVVIGSIFLAAPSVWSQNLLGPWSGTSGGYSGPLNPPTPSGAKGVLVVFGGGEPAMYQYFTTVPGQMYEVSFNMRLPDLSGGVPIEGESTVGPAEFDINLNGTFSSYLVQNRNSWAYYQFDFKATSASTELWQQVPQYITNFGLFQRSDAVFIDNDTAYAVPEPSVCVLALMGSGLLLLRKFTGR